MIITIPNRSIREFEFKCGICSYSVNSRDRRTRDMHFKLHNKKHHPTIKYTKEITETKIKNRARSIKTYVLGQFNQ